MEDCLWQSDTHTVSSPVTPTTFLKLMRATMENRVPVGVGVIVVRQGKVLIGRRNGKNGYNTWSMPGGHLDVGETPEDTAVREVFEETGLVVANPQFIGYTNDIFPEAHKHYLTLWVAVEYTSGKPRVTDTHEMDAFKWVGLAELNQKHNLFLPLVNFLSSPFEASLKKLLNR